MADVLFICTGNIYRSLAAELAFNAAPETRGRHRAASAGTGARPQVLHPEIDTCFDAVKSAREADPVRFARIVTRPTRARV